MNISNNLIKSCHCGNNINFTRKNINNIDVLDCDNCGSVHQLLEGWNEDKLTEFYTKDYHVSYQKTKGVISYKDRYTHDCNVANLRLDEYDNFLEPASTGLDIGSSNSAFVHMAIQRGFHCQGLEPGDNIGDPAVTIKGSLATAILAQNHWDWITMHDSIEHMVDLNQSITQVKKLLKPLTGKIIIDLPDFWTPAGLHHWKSVEHIWLLTQDQMTALLEQHGFAVSKITRPIPGKLVFYAIRNT